MQKKILKKIFFISIISHILVACSSKNTEFEELKTTEAPVAEAVMSVETKREEFSLITTKDGYKLNKFEPVENCYYGAYILSDKKVAFDIKEFEETVKLEHGIYAYNLDINREFPDEWILSCIANMKTPYIVIKFPDMNENYDYTKVEEIAGKIRDYSVPVFLQFQTVDKNISSETYLDYYYKTKEVFSKIASNAAIVWCLDINDVPNSSKYYPGDEFVDWIGVNIIESLNTEKPFDSDVFEKLDYFYYMYQKNKPLIISSFAVSHLNSKDFVYQSDLAADEIEKVYKGIAENYPRIKGVIYYNFNGMEFLGKRDIKDDFTITGEAKIIEKYTEVIKNNRFIINIETPEKDTYNVEYIKSPFKAYKIGIDCYVSDNATIYDLDFQKTGELSDWKLIDGEKYYKVKDIERISDGYFKTDYEKKKIVYK